MNRLVSYLASYLGNSSGFSYPRIRTGKETENLHCTIARASFAALHDTASQPSVVNWDNL